MGGSPEGAYPALAKYADDQRACAFARRALLRIIELTLGTGATQKEAITKLIDAAEAADSRDALLPTIAKANDKVGSSRTVSRRTLIGWITAYRHGGIEALIPKRPGKNLSLPDDVRATLALFKDPRNFTLRECARQVAQQTAQDADALYSRVYRKKQLLPQQLFYAGRNTGAALKALMPFKRRDWKAVGVNGVWVGDGHSMKLKIAHPEHSRPFSPELTLVVDACTRDIMGWSVSLSENCLAVAESLRHGVTDNGVPLIYYSDNGAGQTAKMLDADITGMLGHIGIHHETGIPGSPQGRGVMEIIWKTIALPLARKFDTYQGRTMDRDTLRIVSRDIGKELTAAARATKAGQVATLPKRLPTLKIFLDALTESIDDYRWKHHHRSLPKRPDGKHYTPAEYRQHLLQGVTLHTVPTDELKMLFMPAVLRVARRGEVKWLNNVYFSRDLMLVDGERVQVCYDVRDPQQVIIKKMTGEFICTADFEGNKVDGFPRSQLQDLAEKRVARAVQRGQDIIDTARAELPQTLDAIPESTPLEIDLPPEASQPVTARADGRPMFWQDFEKYEWLLANPELINADDQVWIDQFKTTELWRDLYGPQVFKAAGD